MNYLNVCGLTFKIQPLFQIESSDFLDPFLSDHKEKTAQSKKIVIEYSANLDIPQNIVKKSYNLRRFTHIYDNSKKIIYKFDKNQRIEAKTIVNDDLIRIDTCLRFSDELGIKNANVFLQYLSLETVFIYYNRFILHSSLIEYNGQTLAFCAPKQTGKSTQANLWKELKKAKILNGDRAGIVIEENAPIMAYGLPYAGTSGIYRNEGFPLRAIILLKQSDENELRRANALEAFSMIYPEINMPRTEISIVNKALDLLEALIDKLPIYILSCCPDNESVDLVYKELFENELEKRF